jgi:ferredoxin
MKIIIDWDLCDSHGMCEANAPELFRLNDDDNLQILVDTVPTQLQAAANVAMDSCPRQAISLEVLRPRLADS